MKSAFCTKTANVAGDSHDSNGPLGNRLNNRPAVQSLNHYHREADRVSWNAPRLPLLTKCTSKDPELTGLLKRRSVVVARHTSITLYTTTVSQESLLSGLDGASFRDNIRRGRLKFPNPFSLTYIQRWFVDEGGLCCCCLSDRVFFLARNVVQRQTAAGAPLIPGTFSGFYCPRLIVRRLRDSSYLWQIKNLWRFGLGGR